jgi:hypothetical protein
MSAANRIRLLLCLLTMSAQPAFASRYAYLPQSAD